MYSEVSSAHLSSSKSFFVSTIKLWDSLPDSVKSLPTFSKLKKNPGTLCTVDSLLTVTLYQENRDWNHNL
jgi:hypothetical protein